MDLRSIRLRTKSVERGGSTMPVIRRMRSRGLVVAATTMLGCLIAAPVSATYPGSTEGWIASGITVDGNADIYAALPSGNGLHRLTDDPGFDACPAYSADGK